MFKIVCRVQIKFVISFPFSSVDRGRICMCLWSDNTRTLITHGRTRLNKTLFLRTFHDQNRRREVVDQCSLWKERPQRQICFRSTLLIKYFVRIGLVLGHMMADKIAFYLSSRNSHYTSFSSKDPRNQLNLYQIRKGSRVADLVQGV